MPVSYIGESVHYVADEDPEYPSACRAATVTNVWPLDPSNIPVAGTIVDLVVFDKEGSLHRSGVWFDMDKPVGTWHEINDIPDYSGN